MSEQLLPELQKLFKVLGELYMALQGVGGILFLLIPIGSVGAWRWGVWLLRRLVGSFYQPQAPNDFMTTTSLVIPVYNENVEVFRKALASWAANKPNEIIAVIDYSDSACIQAFREFEKSRPTHGNLTTNLIVTNTPGKRPALVDGIRAATGEIVFLVDSDTLWEKDVLGKALAPFADEKVGGVTVRQNVLAPRSIPQRLFDVYLDIRYLDEMRFLATLGDAVTCISGRTGAYRRSAVLPLLDDMLNETFLGRKVISGDDKSLTHLLQAAGWKVRYQENARVYTPGYSQWSVFLKQRLRWARNSWRADLKALFSRWVWKKPALAFHLIDRLFQPLTSLVAPSYFVFAIYYEQWFTAILLFAWWFFSRGFKIGMHLRRRFSNIIVLPFYIIFSYWFALVKIYAFFTMNQQGWITRWDTNRTERARPLRTAFSYAATVGLVFLVVFAINLLYNQQLLMARVLDPQIVSTEQELPDYDLQAISRQVAVTAPPTAAAGAQQAAEGTTAYEIAVGDTPELVVRKYGAKISPDDLAAWQTGERIQLQLPFKEYAAYRQGLLETRLASVEIAYRPEIDTIVVSGPGAVVDLPTIHAALADEALLAHEGNGIYLLKANLQLKPYTVLLVEAPQVSWLKLKSDQSGFVTISSDGGNVGIDRVRVTSWDDGQNNYDTDSSDGRAYLRVNNARMDIVNAEVAYLGFPRLRVGSGMYGLSWRVHSGLWFGRQLTTGYVENSKIHHNYIGFYSYGATGMVLRNNEIFDNEQYGIDPHDDSNNFIIEDNYVHANGNHGIILSRRCVNNVIRRNRLINNRLHGIMLDRESDRNSIYDNIITGNVDGIALWRSHHNLIFNNQVTGNQRGVRLNQRSANNIIHDNQIQSNTQYGIYLYEGAHSNWVGPNRIAENETAIYLRSADNRIFQNEITGSKRGLFLAEEASGNQVAQNIITTNDLGIYLKTMPDDLVVNNTFSRNQINIRFTDEWHVVKLSELLPVQRLLVLMIKPTFSARINLLAGGR